MFICETLSGYATFENILIKTKALVFQDVVIVVFVTLLKCQRKSEYMIKWKYLITSTTMRYCDIGDVSQNNQKYEISRSIS